MKCLNNREGIQLDDDCFTDVRCEKRKLIRPANSGLQEYQTRQVIQEREFNDYVSESGNRGVDKFVLSFTLFDSATVAKTHYFELFFWAENSSLILDHEVDSFPLDPALLQFLDVKPVLDVKTAGKTMVSDGPSHPLSKTAAVEKSKLKSLRRHTTEDAAGEYCKSRFASRGC